MCYDRLNRALCTLSSIIDLTIKLEWFLLSTGNDVYSGDRYCGNDRYSGLKNPDDAILFTVSGITAIADKKLEILIKKRSMRNRAKVESEAPSHIDHTANHFLTIL